jgi:hypothetical protein
MANKKLTQLETLSTIPANTQQLILVAVDTTSITPVTRKMPFSLIDTYVGNSGVAARLHANAAFNTANSTLIFTQASFNVANTLNVDVQTVSTKTNSAFQIANSTSSYANSAYTQANTSFTRANAANTTSLKYTIGMTPASSFGQNGDVKGMVAFDDVNYIYFCINDYDGLNKIWKRANTTINW